MISVAIIEDDDDIRQGLAILIQCSQGFSCEQTYGDCESAIPEIIADPPDVVLMDIELPGMTGIIGVQKLRERLPEIDIIMLTVHQEEAMIFDSLCAGASGYLIKTTQPAKLLDAIKDVHEGGSPMSPGIARLVVQSFQSTSRVELTRREKEILSQLCKGMSYKMIAEFFSISSGTVHSHLKNIYKKLHVNSQAAAVAKALQERLV
jgi:DNA-binding NarL/FixJ family response regulator